jgi:hypothetical protein
MMYELKDFGFSTAIGIGGDPIVGTTHIDALAAFEADPDTKAIVMIGEIGGDAEERAAAYIKDHVTKPVVGYVAGFTAPEGKTMGHAGAIVSGSSGTAAAKKEALEAVGVKVGKTPSETAALMREILQRSEPPDTDSSAVCCHFPRSAGQTNRWEGAQRVGGQRREAVEGAVHERDEGPGCHLHLAVGDEADLGDRAAVADDPHQVGHGLVVADLGRHVPDGEVLLLGRTRRPPAPRRCPARGRRTRRAGCGRRRRSRGPASTAADQRSRSARRGPRASPRG